MLVMRKEGHVKWARQLRTVEERDRSPQPFAFRNLPEVAERKWCSGSPWWMSAAHRCPGVGLSCQVCHILLGIPIASTTPAPLGKSCSPLGAQPWDWRVPCQGGAAFPREKAACTASLPVRSSSLLRAAGSPKGTGATQRRAGEERLVS